MGDRGLYIIGAFVLAVLIPFLPKLIQARVWIMRRAHLFRLADWHERNRVVLVRVLRAILAVAILVLLLLAVGII